MMNLNSSGTKLYYLIGPSYSGKSTWAKDHQKELNAEVVSSDAVREELWGDESIQREPATVFEVVHRRVKQFLVEGKSVIFDSTGLQVKHRRQFLESIRGIRCEKIAICFFVPYETLIARMALRERVVPEYVIRKQLLGFQMPHESEGWDGIFRVGVKPNGVVLEEIIHDAIELSHDNPYHKETVGHHCIAAAEYAVKTFGDYTSIICAQFHDVGKPFAKDFKNAKGEPSEVAHFYGHECYGAYLIGLYFPKGWKTVANVVQWHMAPWVYSEKKLKALENRLGPELWDLIMKVHECDKAGTTR